MTVEYDLLIVEQIENEIADLVIGKSLFVGPVRAADDDGGVDHCAVFVLRSGGLFSEPLHADNGRTLRRPSVQIRVRSDQGIGAFQRGQRLAGLVYDAVDQKPPNGICEVRALDSAPSYIGMDDDGHHEWSLNLSLLLDIDPLVVYWGVSSAGGSGEAFVKALANSSAATSRNREFNVAPNASEKIYYAFPSSYGTPTFQVGALPGGFFLADSPTVDGLAYSLWESDNLGLGLVTVKVT